MRYIVYWADYPMRDVFVAEYEHLSDALQRVKEEQKKALPYQNFYVGEEEE